MARAKKIMKDTGDIGWGFQDGVEDIYNAYFGNK